MFAQGGEIVAVTPCTFAESKALALFSAKIRLAHLVLTSPRLEDKEMTAKSAGCSGLTMVAPPCQALAVHIGAWNKFLEYPSPA